jgi:DNA-binding transcriptional ArsR family regulator
VDANGEAPPVLNVVTEIDDIQASMLRALASAHRLRIIHVLGRGTCEVNELADELGLAQSAVSQHLAALRAVGVVEPIRDGRHVRYRIADAEILTACSLMRSVIVRRLTELGSLAAASAATEARAGNADLNPPTNG